MERELETMFDTVNGLQASLVDVNNLEDICRKQQAITMKRIASWLRMNGRIYTQNWEVSVGKEIGGLADELDYLSEVSQKFQS
jgi:hypothetical protein|tara:strand:- start:3135 stop:3383 length:249 start_codon:yes stop_codon:yes gene_type:complete